MKNIFSTVTFLMLISVGVAGQTNREEEFPETANEPKREIKVNKEYDEEGNLIRYDSTYSYFYSGFDDNNNRIDSILDDFRRHIDRSSFFHDDPFFNDLFFTDSLLYYDFFKSDFFSNRFEMNKEWMERMFSDMDSLKNRYFMDRQYLFDR
jgi:hypothetical protein